MDISNGFFTRVVKSAYLGFLLFAVAIPNLAYANIVGLTFDLDSPGMNAVDHVSITFDDTLGAYKIPVTKNFGVLFGYMGNLDSSLFGNNHNIYMNFNNDISVFDIYQECPAVMNCYISSIAPTNFISTSSNPLLANQLGTYLQQYVAGINNLPNSGLYVVSSYDPKGVSSWYGSTIVKNATVSISPVPEPETYALMLIGLCFISFSARRKH